MKISVIIVSYNVRHYLEQCLHSVFVAAERLPGGRNDVEVYLIDNASADSSVEYLRSRFSVSEYPQLHIIANSGNVGFGRANNQAVKRSRGKYILFLNPDTLLGESVLADTLSFCEAHRDMGAVGTMMLQSNGAFAYESRRGIPTPWTSFCKMCGLSALFPHSRLLGRYYMRYLDAGKPSEIEIVSGAYMLVRRDVLGECGSFDEDFFMYGEDIDLSFRLVKSGRKNYYVPSPILHYKGESTHKSNYRYVHVFYGAMLTFFKKHYRHYRFIFSLPIKAAILFKAVIALLQRQIRDFVGFLIPSGRHRRVRQLYIGRNGETISRIAEQWGLDIDMLEADSTTLPQPVLPEEASGDYVHVIYDLDNFSREYVLKAFYTSRHRCHIGTYSSATQVLITGSKTFALNPFRT